jgi:hypothetical protein
MTLPDVNAMRMPDLFEPPCERAAVNASPRLLLGRDWLNAETCGSLARWIQDGERQRIT